jgi:hypothetical protein
MTMRGRFQLALLGVALLTGVYSIAADAPSNVQLNIAAAKPRSVEELTAGRISRDYAAAWANMAAALQNGNAGLLGGSFVGPAREDLVKLIAAQNQSGMRSRYLNHSHKLEAVFYAPEGDLVELHDTASCDLQWVDGSNVLRDEHVTLNYIVLMTPGADGWVVRQLQAVPGF